jgi:hypothetical protein
MSAFVYVSCAEEGEIGIYRLQDDGVLNPHERVAAQP